MNAFVEKYLILNTAHPVLMKGLLLQRSTSGFEEGAAFAAQGCIWQFSAREKNSHATLFLGFKNLLALKSQLNFLKHVHTIKVFYCPCSVARVQNTIPTITVCMYVRGKKNAYRFSIDVLDHTYQQETARLIEFSRMTVQRTFLLACGLKRLGFRTLKKTAIWWIPCISERACETAAGPI